jgi:hypothetical protein
LLGHQHRLRQDTRYIGIAAALDALAKSSVELKTLPEAPGAAKLYTDPLPTS